MPRPAAAGARALLGAWLLLGLAQRVRADDLASALYIRQDSDRTTVISPHVRLGKQLQEGTQVSASYAADVWTSASIDIRASASKRPVTEQRDELQLSVQQEWIDLHVQAGYRFSSEPDYTSHGASISGSYDLAGNAATLSAGLHVFADAVGRSGDPKFSRQQGTYDASFTFTQIIDPLMFVSATYELAHLQGYQASPYRFVGIGADATGFGCTGTSECLPERVPRARTRHAFALLARRAFGEVFSAGLNYRFYIDDWALSSHTLLAELGWNLGTRSLLSLRYRFYAQTHADFYRERYAQLLPSGFRTRDKELSPMRYHRVGLEFEQIAWSSEEGRKLRATLALSGNRYVYDDFVGLDAVQALEVTAAVLLEL
jgi:hypothetical protein